MLDLVEEAFDLVTRIVEERAEADRGLAVGLGLSIGSEKLTRIGAEELTTL